MALKAPGNPGLTRREREIAALVAEGLTNREIAQRLFISERTADGHLEHIREKLGVSSRAQVAAWFVAQSRLAPLAGVAEPEATPEPARPVVARITLASRVAIAVAALLLFGVAALIYGQVNRAASPSRPLITTFAGDTTVGYDQGGYSGDFGQAAAAQLSHPTGIAATQDGVYIADNGNRVIRRVDPNGEITTIAGGGSAVFTEGANATTVKLPRPCCFGVAVASDGRIFFGGGPFVFRRDPDLTIHLVHFPDASAPLGDAWGLVFDAKGNLYIADRFGNTVRRFAPDGSLSTYAGSGVAGFGGDGGAATGALLNAPAALALDGRANLYVADQGNNRIRRVDSLTGIITTAAGSDEIYGFSGDGGPATKARLSLPAGIVVHQDWIYIADAGNNRIRQVSLASGLITTLAGTGATGFSGDGGPAIQAALFGPLGLEVDSRGNLLVADDGNNRVRQIHLSETAR
jgi:DNA-binding CsgD family transcriptional regulator/sugar lactone lactonase YvrE